MKTRTKYIVIAFLASVILLSCNYKDHILTALVAGSYDPNSTYTYMAYNGTTMTTDTTEGHMTAELLNAIESKYGASVASTYYQCMQTGCYTPYYNAIGSVSPSYKEGFVYSTNGMRQEKCGCQITEQYLIISGLSNVSELIQASSNAGYGSDANGIKSYIHAVKTGTVSKASIPTTKSSQEQPKATESAPAQSEPTATTQSQSEKKSESVKEPEKKKEISHGLYDSVSDEAEKAFVELLSDGVDDSCFVQTKADAEDRVVSAGTVSKTLSNKEDGKIEFFNKGEKDDYSEFSYSIKFPQIEVKDDVDLAATYAELDTSKFENVYQLVFITEQTLPSEVEITLNVSGTQGEKFYLLRGKDDSDYNTFATADCDDKGCITFKTNALDNIIVSKTDIVSVREAEEKAEQETIEKEVKSEEALAAASTESSIEQSNEVNAEDSGVSTVMLIVVGIIAIILIVAGIMVYRKNR